ncbi:hypothetical protein Trydic_g23345 [Trypoxylus dichotomus]
MRASSASEVLCFAYGDGVLLPPTAANEQRPSRTPATCNEVKKLHRAASAAAARRPGKKDETKSQTSMVREVKSQSDTNKAQTGARPPLQRRYCS